eukprot:1232413-Rhodomonas_salina.1
MDQLFGPAAAAHDADDADDADGDGGDDGDDGDDGYDGDDGDDADSGDSGDGDADREKVVHSFECGCCLKRLNIYSSGRVVHNDAPLDKSSTFNTN